jgi:hypothetical protein
MVTNREKLAYDPYFYKKLLNTSLLLLLMSETQTEMFLVGQNRFTEEA